MSEKLTRQQIYDRIRATSKESHILEEMQRLGFWDTSDVPSVPEMLIRREEDINRELAGLMKQDRTYQDPEEMLKAMRKDRMKKAREKREQTRLRNKQKRLDKARRWEELQRHQIIYLGEDVSKGLSNTEHDAERLLKYRLPVFNSVEELAAQMHTDLPTLRYLAYHRKVSKTSHYHTFEIPKKSGGKRKISAPKKKLKNLQSWILQTILAPIPIDEAAHGFVQARSIVTNARPHTGQDIVVNVDLKDFFPSIDYRRVKGLFRGLGYSEQMATVFALLCTQPGTETVEMDGVTYHVQTGSRALPQGSPASPAVSNLIAYRLDRKVAGLARKYGFTYTRYADDMSFSAPAVNGKNISKLLLYLAKVVESEGFTVHPGKTHVMRKGMQQKVTGVVVNSKPNVERQQLRKFRALLHNVETHGWNGQQWGKAKHPVHAIEGYIHFVQMVNPAKGKQFKDQLVQIVRKHGYPAIEQPAEPGKQPVTEPVQATEPPKPAKPEAPNTGDWWNILS